MKKYYAERHGLLTKQLQIDFDEFAVDFESEIFTCEKNGLKYQFIDLVKK